MFLLFKTKVELPNDY